MRRISRKSLRWLPVMLFLLMTTWFFSYSAPLILIFIPLSPEANAVVFSLVIFFEVVSATLVSSIIFGLKELNGYVYSSWYLFSSFFCIATAHLVFVEMSYQNSVADEWFALAGNVSELAEIIVLTCGIVLVLKGLGEELRKAEINGAKITILYYGPVERAVFSMLYLGSFTAVIKLFSVYVSSRSALGITTFASDLIYVFLRVVLFFFGINVYRAVRLTCGDIYERATK